MIETLRTTLPARVRRQIDRPEKAAVLVAIVDDAGPRRLLLTRRAEELPTHRGQVAFPGGLMEADEDDPALAALREAQEEIGLPPESVEILGLLDDVPTRSDRVAVTPVVGRIARLPPLTPSRAEVARIFTIPIALLRQRERWTERREESSGRPVHFFEHDGETLWGLSARIVFDLLDLGSGVPPSP